MVGNGGMATVLKARDHVLNRNVAVKILKDEFTTDDEFVKRFNTEAQSVASLTHPNIVAVHDVGKQGTLYYIVMELISGKTLKEIILEDGALPWKWSVSVAVQIASALEAAHKNNIIHRDIKPHNIIITEDGIAKVTDFGIAKAVSNSTITTFGTTIGSVHYFSPEHARGGFTDAKSDIYSLGVVLYEMVTGRVPFDSDTPVSVALKHMQEEPKEPSIINPGIPTSVNKIILKAMQKDITTRYQNAGEMLKDLNMALKNPDGDFVDLNKLENDFPTQRMPNIYDKTLEERINERNGGNKSQMSDGGQEKMSKDEKKKEPKGLKKFIKKHKVISGIIGVILLFFIVMFSVYFIFDATRPKQVILPNLVGMSVEEAENTLKSLKVKLEIKSEEYDDEIPADYIISQDPEYIENFRIRTGTKITVIVSKGAEIVEVPVVKGLEKEEAIKLLSELGLTIQEEYENSDKIPKDIVIRQSPEEHTEVKGSSVVILYISQGTAKSTVPNLIGKTEEEAKKLITDNKLAINTIKYEEDFNKPNGTVIKQDLDAGKEVDEMTKITITVNRLPEIKSGVVNINVKTLTGYVEKTDEEGHPISASKVELMVKITSNGVEDTVYKQNVAQDLANVPVNVQGIGTVTVKVYIDGVQKKMEQFNLENSSINI